MDKFAAEDYTVIVVEQLKEGGYKRYKLKATDAVTGEVKQEAEFEPQYFYKVSLISDVVDVPKSYFN